MYLAVFTVYIVSVCNAWGATTWWPLNSCAEVGVSPMQMHEYTHAILVRWRGHKVLLSQRYWHMLQKLGITLLGCMPL